MKRTLDFIIVGSARCGTTSLYHYLKQCDGIFLPKVKEPKYFSRDAYREGEMLGLGDKFVHEAMIKNLRDYEDLFKRAGMKELIGEASSDYLYHHKHAIPEIKEHSGDPHIIILLRNPIYRSWSAYGNLTRDARETLSFENALLVERDRRRTGYDWMWHYINGSLYCDAVKSYRENFSNVHVYFYEDFIQNPAVVVKDILKFLNVDTDIGNIDTSTVYSISGRVENPFIKLLMTRTGVMSKMRTALLTVIPRDFLESIVQRFISKSKLSEAGKMLVLEQTKHDVIALSKIYPRVKNIWREYYE